MELVVNDLQSSWYGLAAGLSSLGIPFHLYTDVAEALPHDVILIYPGLNGANTSAANLQSLAAHVRKGGTVVAFSVLGGGLEQVFGFESASEDPLHRTVEFAPSSLRAQFLESADDAVINLGSLKNPGSGMGGISYRTTKLPPIATYEDGSAAITQNVFTAEGREGHAYAVGVDWSHYFMRAHGGRAPDAVGSYVNAYHAGLDTVLRFIAAIYRQGENDAVLLSPTPSGKDLSILMTHDIDFTHSIVNAPLYAQVERDAGVSATYFIQTKYVKDYSDDAFFKPSTVQYLTQLQNAGMEIGSHSVAHSRVFDELEEGNGSEQYPDYRPFVKQFRQVEGATIAGELRVSKFLLETQGAKTVVSFRPGHLSFPYQLPQMLDATGYRFSSSMTANEALTNLPYRDMVDRGFKAPSPVYEFPVTIEDEEGVLGDRVDAAIDVSRKIAAYHGVVTVLVHTDSTDHKLEFTRKYLAAMKDQAWFATMGEFGRWWAARESVALLQTASSDSAKSLRVETRQPLSGLTLLLPAGWRYQGGLAGTTQRGERLVLGELTDAATLEFTVVGR